MFTSSERYYRSSGAVPIGGLLLCLGFTFGAVTLLSVVYAVFSIHIPLVYLKVLGTLFYGRATGMILVTTLDGIKVRNRSLSLMLGVIVGLFAIYAAWVAFIWGLARQDGITVLAFSIFDLAEWLKFFSQFGLWEMHGGERPTGAVLQIIWCIEAFIVFSGTISQIRDVEVPFCENCSEWSHTVAIATPFALPVSPDQLTRDLEDERYSELFRLGALPADPNDSLRVAVNLCPKCDARWLSINRMIGGKSPKWDKKTALPQNLIIPKSEADVFLWMQPDSERLPPELTGKPEID